MVTIYIDNQPYTVKEGTNLLNACLSLGFNIPYFCWHPALGSVGACRLCAVKQYKDENDKQGKLVMSCMTPVQDNMHISIEEKEAREFRKCVLEWLMINHPHDCPICDEGGECHLQDMTVMTGHNYREYRFQKRTYRNQYLGPFINHEMNRCIQCFRCVRFYRDFAGGEDLQSFGCHDHLYFGRQKDGVLENYFSGNLVEVCPTGVFSDKTFKEHYTRKWDLQNAPSICTHCGLGCNTIVGERYGTVRRIRSRYNHEVNGYFLCDRGRFGYEFVNDENRILFPTIHENEKKNTKTIQKDTASQIFRDHCGKDQTVIGVGSPRASLESNSALQTLVGKENFYAGISESQHSVNLLIKEILSNTPASIPSLQEIEQADAVLILGEDVINTAPMIALSLQQSVKQQPMEQSRKLGIPDWHANAVAEVLQEAKGPLFIASPYGTPLDELAQKTYLCSPDDIARLGFAIAHVLHSDAPNPENLNEETSQLANTIADALQKAKRPLVISGPSLGNAPILHAASNIALSLYRSKEKGELCLTVPECNTMGLTLLEEKNLDDAVQRCETGKIHSLAVLENDLYRRIEKSKADSLFQHISHVVAIDHIENATTDKADLTLPAATFAESTGTYVNNESRAQRFYSVKPSEHEIQTSWRWILDIGIATARFPENLWINIDELISELTEANPIFEPISSIAPTADFRITGQSIPRQLHRYSGRTAMDAHDNIHEMPPVSDTDSPLVYSMEGYKGQPPSSLISEFWSPGWNSPQAINKFQIEIDGPLRNDTPGKRLIVKDGTKEQSFYQTIPDRFKKREHEWWMVPIYHIFGSEELSQRAPAIAEVSPKPYLLMNQGEAEKNSLQPDDILQITGNDCTQRLPLLIRNDVPEGICVIPMGLMEMPGSIRPQWVTIKKTEDKQKET